VIYVGIDDTDMPGTPGTNQLARALAARWAGRFHCKLIVRHQLLRDPRVPFTSKNSAAALLVDQNGHATLDPLIADLRSAMHDWFVEGSDPGLCVTTAVPQEVRQFAKRCQQEVVDQKEARDLAARFGLHLEGLGGTEDGVVGALAAVGLVADGDDGRVVKIDAWPDDLDGLQDIETLSERDVEVRSTETGRVLTTGQVDVGKHLRPNYRRYGIVLFVQPAADTSNGSPHARAVRLT